MRLTQCVLTIAITLAAAELRAGSNGPVVVEGTTNQMMNDGTYLTLGHVEIQIYRRGNPVFPRPVESDDQGVFKISVPKGEPFTIVFMGASKLPEMQYLSGEAGKNDHLHVVLITPAQAKKERIPGAEKIEYLAKLLPEGDTFSKRLREMLRQSQ